MSELQSKSEPARWPILGPPVFPDNVALAVSGGALRIMFLQTPNPGSPDYQVVVSQIVALPQFAMHIAANLIAAAQHVDSDLQLDQAQVDRFRALLDGNRVEAR